jgi:hypothetical protein
VLLWCGGNETYLGLDVSAPDKAAPTRDLFEQHYREVCERLDPDRHYHVNSPFGGAFDNCAPEGDCHVRNYDWFLPGDHYPRMVTESTRLTVPLRATLESHLGADLAWPEGGFDGRRREFNDPVMPPAWIEALSPNTHWVNSRVGEVQDFFDADGTPDGLLFRLGAGTSRFIRTTLERLRRGKPASDAAGPRRTMGHYWWKLNDTWPMIYASLVDALLQPNMAYYAMRRALTPLLISFEPGDRVNVWVVNDTGCVVDGTLTVREMDQQGAAVRGETRAPVHAAPGESVLVTGCDEIGQFYNKNPLSAELRGADGALLAEQVAYVVPDRRNWFPPARLGLEREGDCLVLSTDVTAHWVELRGEGLGWGFEDNYFDLLPGRRRRVRLLTAPACGGALTARAVYSPHVTRLNWV